MPTPCGVTALTASARERCSAVDRSIAGANAPPYAGEVTTTNIAINFLMTSNALANLRQVSGAAVANANVTHPARAETDAARRQVQRFDRQDPRQLSAD